MEPVTKYIQKLIVGLPYYLQLMRFEKPIGWLLLLWPTLIALWVSSDGNPSAAIVWIFVIGVFITRSAGCVINDIVDKEIDPLVHRTKMRPLAAKKLTVKQAICFCILLGVLALGLLLLLPERVWLWSIPAVIITMVYPFMKRLIVAPQMVLGVAFSLGIPMAFATVSHSFDLVFLLLMLANILWVLIYDTVYAMSDKEDDLKIGVKSTAIWFASKDKLIIGVLQLLNVLCWVFLMQLLELNASFYLTLLIVLSIFVYQQWLIKERNKEQCFQAFLQNGWLGAVLWFGVVLGYQ